MKLRTWCWCLLLGVGVYSAGAQNVLTQQDVEARLAGPFVLLRGMYDGDKLNFDAQGNLMGQAGSSPLTLSAVTGFKVRLNDSELEISGNRSGLEFDASDKSMPVTVRAERIGKHDKLVVRIARDPQHPEALGAALNKVFAVGFDDALADGAPDYWQAWLRHYLHPSDPNGAAPPGMEKADVKMTAPGVTPPRLTFDPDPTFSNAARQRKFQGVAVVGLIVDAHGEPHQVHVVRPLGMGLDELAVATVRRYKFAPAIYQGRMVAVEINIEVNFRIY